MVAELEDTEDSQNSEDPDYRQVTASEEKETRVCGKYGEQIHDAEETDYVSGGLSDAEQSQDVLYCEKDSEEPFYGI